MDYILPTFKAVSLIFAIAAVATGARATIYPNNFSISFGLPLRTDTATSVKGSGMSKPTSMPLHGRDPAYSYIALMGVRQLATGLTLITFAYQDKWTEIAAILSIIGILVAGTDGFHLARAGAKRQGLFHAIPGALIAILAGSVLYLRA